ncbi:MAG TPA: hypothetical protein VI997_09685, partial [Candidatus Thermoplasmatota archaeon]|nr:hypothetical protein [Candidatus Thermoplasmatota archaeon]
TGGRLTVEAGPTAALYSAATEVATASGSLAASTDSLRFPQQTFRDSLGALEVRQGEGTWVDLRGLLSASRADGGNVALAFRFQSLAGAPQVVAANGRVDALGALRAVDDAVAPDAAYARLVVTDIPADAWRAASTRTLEAAALVGDTRVDCATTTLDWCLDAATNDASTLDLWILDPAAGWTASVATFDVEVRT